jgi:tetratricopeptide (TPR) repeat protein
VGDVVELFPRARRGLMRAEAPRSADEWCDEAAALEATAPEQAVRAYRRALALAPDHADAQIDLGRLLHGLGRPGQAVLCYVRAVEVRPGDATALFNLGVALEDLGLPARAAGAYQAAVAADPSCADASFNLARLCERRGDRVGALRHLAAYRRAVARAG